MGPRPVGTPRDPHANLFYRHFESGEVACPFGKRRWMTLFAGNSLSFRLICQIKSAARRGYHSPLTVSAAEALLVEASFPKMMGQSSGRRPPKPSVRPLVGSDTRHDPQETDHAQESVDRHDHEGLPPAVCAPTVHPDCFSHQPPLAVTTR